MAASMRNIVANLSKTIFKIRGPLARQICAYSTETQLEVPEEVAYPSVKPEYPPGNWSEDLGLKNIWKHYDNAKSLLSRDDVRERLEYMAGEKAFLMTSVLSWDNKPQTLAFKQFITRTKIIKGLPEIYSTHTIDEQLYKTLKQLVIAAIVNEHQNLYLDGIERRKVLERHAPAYKAHRLWSKIIDIIVNLCSLKHEHLQRAQYDEDVRLETFWTVSGFAEKYNIKRGRLDFQYKGSRNKQIRTELPLPEFVPLDNGLCLLDDNVPVIDYLPTALAQPRITDRPITCAGHWIGSPCEFIPLSLEVLQMPYYTFAKKYKEFPDLIDEGWSACSLTNGFTTCVAQAHNLGFNYYHDVTYPITTQTLVVEGNTVQMSAYQLNTLHLWQNRDINPYANLVWHGDRVRLYDDVKSDGEVTGFNDSILRTLISFVTLETTDGHLDLRPYVQQGEKPCDKTLYINHVGDEPLPVTKIERFQYPTNSVYF